MKMSWIWQANVSILSCSKPCLSWLKRDGMAMTPCRLKSWKKVIHSLWITLWINASVFEKSYPLCKFNKIDKKGALWIIRLISPKKLVEKHRKMDFGDEKRKKNFPQ